MTPVRVLADRVTFMGSQLRFWGTTSQFPKTLFSAQVQHLVPTLGEGTTVHESVEKSQKYVPVARNRPLVIWVEIGIFRRGTMLRTSDQRSVYALLFYETTSLRNGFLLLRSDLPRLSLG